MPAGRPSSFTKSKFDQICELLEGGLSLRAICSREDMPDKSTFMRWLAAKPEIRDQYARACEIRADQIFDEMLLIADNSSRDMVTLDDGTEVVDYNVINRDKLRIDTRKWILSRMNPKKYGDKLQQEITGNSIKVTFGEE